MIFDLDGTLVDSTYAHTLAWQAAFRGVDWLIPGWEIHRLIGMGGELLMKSVARARGHLLPAAKAKSLAAAHAEHYATRAHDSSPLPGAVELLNALSKGQVPHGIATSGKKSELTHALQTLNLSARTKLVTGDQVKAAKPEPDLFLRCQQRLRVAARDCVVVGDAIWDIHAARRSGIAAIGVLTGGFGEQELYNAGAMRVYRDLADLQHQIDQLGIAL